MVATLERPQFPCPETLNIPSSILLHRSSEIRKRFICSVDAFWMSPRCRVIKRAKCSLLLDQFHAPGPIPLQTSMVAVSSRTAIREQLIHILMHTLHFV